MQIGLLESAGHASGPHSHYEVIVNGQPLDPETFIELARLVSEGRKVALVSAPSFGGRSTGQVADQRKGRIAADLTARDL